MKEINVGLLGTRFMGRAHTNAYLDVAYHFKLPLLPVLRAACDTDISSLEPFAAQYGWKTTETSWEKLIERDDIDIVDICTPNDSHELIAVKAAKHGKHIICEKPIARNSDEARRMLVAVQDAGVTNMVAFNYRRVPAIQFAKSLIDKGKIGKVNHFNAVYYQDWLVDPEFPYVWRNDIKTSGSGAHGDMNAHIVDLARYLVGEIEAVNGIQKIFVKERRARDGKKYPVTADDSTYFMARFQDNAIGSFLASRFATGRKNYLRLEIFGSEGSLVFNLERLNELEYFSRNDELLEQGFQNILVTENMHPYINAWWPPGHIIGWEHTFIHEIKDFIEAAAEKKPVHADFFDGWRCQLVLDAVQSSAETGKWVTIPA